jgi:tetratricopeptide (TPR) repeat protein
MAEPRMAYTREIEKLKRQWDENPKGTSFAPLAELYRKDGQHEKAMEVLRVGLESNPRHIPGNIVRGRCCLDLKQDAEAEVAFRRALELDPENVIALKALADITERAGRLDEASSWLQQLVSVDPSNDDARDQMTRVATAMAAPDPEPVPEPEAVAEPEPVAAAEPVPTPLFDEAFSVEAPPPAPFAPSSAAVAEPLGLTPPTPDPFAHAGGAGSPPPAPVSGFESAEFDAAAHRDVAGQGVPGMTIEHAEERSAEPLIGGGAASGTTAGHEFDVGLEKTEEIVLRVSSATEFQTASASEDMADSFRASGSSEFQTASAADDMAAALAAKSAQPPHVVEPGPPAPPAHAESAPASSVEPPAPAEPEAPPAAAEPVVASVLPETIEPVEFQPPIVLSTPEPFVFMAPEPELAPPMMATPEPAPAPEVLPAEVPAQRMPEMEPATASVPAPADDLKIIYPPAPAPSAEADEPAIGGEPEPVVTETMAELYLRQGLRHEALRVFKQLSERAPGDLHLRERVTQLESDLAAFSTNRRAAPAITAAATGGESVGSFFHGLLGSPVGTSAKASAPPSPASVEAMEPSRGGAPTRPAQDSLSLSAIFGEDASPVPPTVGNGSETPAAAPAGLSTGGVSFDQFFGDQPGNAESAGPVRRASRAGGADEDLDQFQNWLKSLKR